MLYGFLKGILPLFFRAVYRTEVYGRENVPKEGGAIIAANHISLWDPPFLGAFCPRRVSFMAKKELFEHPVFSSLITRLGAFPVNRGAADRAAIKTALSVLAEGKCLGLFPEGTRSKTGKLGEAEAGIGLIAYKANVPIVPVAITGTNSKGLFPKFTIRFGKPIPAGDPKDKKLMTTLPVQIMSEIQKLLDEQKT